MIKLFRKVRQQLLTDNKVRTYFIYAVGEIILVVIGILIALQINIWNENRKQENLKLTYISRLISDIKQDTLNIHTLKKETSGAQLVITDLIHALNSESDNTEMTQLLENYFNTGWMLRSFISNDNTYTYLSQTGNMAILKNTGTVENLIKYYAFTKESRLWDSGNENWVSPLDIELTKLTPALEFDPITGPLFKDKDKQVAVNDLLAHKALLERSAAAHYWYNNYSLDRLETFETEANHLLKVLNGMLE